MKGKSGPGAHKRRGLDVVDLLESAAPWRRGLAVVAFLALVLCVFFPELVFQNRIFLVPDATAWESFASVGRETLESGTYPLWNPYLFCGMPSYPSQAYTPYVYPVSFLTHILHAYLGFPEMAWLLIHYLLAGVGVYLLCRSLGIRSAVSLLAGVVFMTIPNYLAIGANGHGSQACSIAYMPYALLLARNVLRGYRRIPMAAILAITLGFQMLRGHIQISYYTYLMIGLLLIFESIHLLRKGDKRAVLLNLGVIFCAIIAALGIAAVLVLPVRDYASLSIRGGGSGGGLDYGYATGWSLHPKEMMTFLFPWAFGFGKATYWGEMPFTDFPNYLGIVTVVFSVVALFLVRDRWKWFLILTAALSTLMSFGKFFPVLYKPMFRLLPYFNKFRVPVMVLIVQQLALVVLMGMGIEEFLRRYREGKLPDVFKAKFMKLIVIGGLVILVLILLASGGIRDSVTSSAASTNKVSAEWALEGARAFTGDLIKTVTLFVSVFALLYLSAARKSLPGLLFLVLAVIAVADLFFTGEPILHPEKTWKSDGYRIIRPVSERENYKRPDEVIGFLKEDTSYFRIFPAPAAPFGQWSHSTPPFSDNRFMVSGIFSLGGYHAAKLKSYQDVMDQMFASFNRKKVPVQILNMLNAKYIVSMFPLFREGSSFPLLRQLGGTYIYRNESALPRVFIVDRFRVLSSGDALKSLLSPAFDPSHEVLLEKEPPVIPESAEGSHAEIVDYRLNYIKIETHIEKPCILVLGEIAYPDWKAEVDGRETEILTSNYCLRALAMDTGDHEIEFMFSSRILRISLIVSITALVLAAAVPPLFWLFVERRV